MALQFCCSLSSLTHEQVGTLYMERDHQAPDISCLQQFGLFAADQYDKLLAQTDVTWCDEDPYLECSGITVENGFCSQGRLLQYRTSTDGAVLLCVQSRHHRAAHDWFDHYQNGFGFNFEGELNCCRNATRRYLDFCSEYNLKPLQSIVDALFSEFVGIPSTYFLHGERWVENTNKNVVFTPSDFGVANVNQLAI